MVQLEQVRVGALTYPERAKAFFELVVIYLSKILTNLDNIIKNPTEPKYRRINMGNQVYQNKVATVFGGNEALQAIGFEPEDTFLVNKSQDIEEMKEIVKAL